MPTDLAKHQLVLYALHLSGGSGHSVPHEDVAIRAHALFPDQFGWARHPHLPDKETARQALVRAREEASGPRVTGRVAGGGWRLTPAGSAWVRDHEAQLQAQAQGSTYESPRQRGLRRLERYRASAAFRRFSRSPDRFVPDPGELAELFRCRVDADRRVWDQRLEDLLAFGQEAGDDRVVAFVAVCRRYLEGTRRAEAEG